MSKGKSPRDDQGKGKVSEMTLRMVSVVGEGVSLYGSVKLIGLPAVHWTDA